MVVREGLQARYANVSNRLQPQVAVAARIKAGWREIAQIVDLWRPRGRINRPTLARSKTNLNYDLERYLDEAFASHGKWRALVDRSPSNALEKLLAMRRAAKSPTDDSTPPPPQQSATLLSASLQKNELR